MRSTVAYNLLPGAVSLRHMTDNSIGGDQLFDSSIGQAKLSTTTASGNVALNSGTSNSYTLTGGSYSWWTAGSTTGSTAGMAFGNGDVAIGLIGLSNFDASQRTFYVDERYVQASPPYNIGNGDISLFIFLLMSKNGDIIGTSIAPDPPWAYHGPTDIKTGKQQVKSFIDCLDNISSIEGYFKEEKYKIIPEGHERKNADMHLVPHPFNNVGPGETVIMIDPFCDVCDKLYQVQQTEGARIVRNAILKDALIIDNEKLKCKAPNGVMPVSAKWKLTK